MDDQVKIRWVYSFGDGKAEGRAEMKNLLGGKGANLAEMSNLGLPVPPGFTITTEVCTYYYKQRPDLPVRPEGSGHARRWPPSSGASAPASATRKTRCWFRSAPAPAPPCPA